MIRAQNLTSSHPHGSACVCNSPLCTNGGFVCCCVLLRQLNTFGALAQLKTIQSIVVLNRSTCLCKIWDIFVCLTPTNAHNQPSALYAQEFTANKYFSKITTLTIKDNLFIQKRSPYQFTESQDQQKALPKRVWWFRELPKNIYFGGNQLRTSKECKTFSVVFHRMSQV